MLMHFSVAAHFIQCGKLKVGSRELSVTQFTGNIREFPPSPSKEEQRDQRGHTDDVSDDKRHVDGTCVLLQY